jgi:dCTP deaminase
MVKNDVWIRQMALEHKLIDPFEPNQIRDGKISFGTSSYGYDLRISDEFMVMKSGGVLDPKGDADSRFEKIKVKDNIVLAPNAVVLAKSVEYFKIPRDIITIAFGKSTYARCGLLVNVTPFEPEWEGFVTLSLVNVGVIPIRVYANEGIAQVLFLQAPEICQQSYADKKGKYQAQTAITPAKI